MKPCFSYRNVSAALLACVAFCGASTFAAAALPVEVEAPQVALRGHDTTITINSVGYVPESSPVEIVDAAGKRVAEGTLRAGSALELTLQAVPGDGRYELRMPSIATEAFAFELRTLPGWLALLPPLLAIALALLFRQVVPALAAGIWVGAWLVTGDPLSGILRTVDRYIVHSLTDADHVSIVIFSLMLGGMVGVMARAGGTLGLVELMRPYATNRRRGQVVTWMMGLAVFFDDYANTLIVGNTMRPVTDRLRISREKLAYIVDSTAAPVAAIGLISTWIGYELALISDALKSVSIERDAYAVFLQSLQYNFYPMLALAFGLMVATSLRDFGPMLKAERRAETGQLLDAKAVPLSDFDSPELQPVEGKPHRWVNAVLPVLVVLLVTLIGLWMTGRASLLADGDPAGATGFFALGLEGLGRVFGQGNSFNSLLWASTAGCLTALGLALGQRLMSLGEGVGAWLAGIRSMLAAIVTLLLAWSIAAVCVDLDTAGFLVGTVSDLLDPRFVPAIVFCLAAITAFATGTSWGTMGILLPLAVPTAIGVAQSAGMDADASYRIMLGALSAVLAGAIFGDHCSPISDTTVMSSMASGCDHVDHVRTQLPYALLVGLVALVSGYIPAAFGVNPLICLAFGAAVLAGVMRWRGRR